MEDRSIRRVGVYGGTFSPPHRGHMHAASAFLSSGLVEHLLIVPTFMTPMKAREEFTAPEDRLAMCRLAFSFSPQIEVSDMEIKRGGKSYTSETLTALSASDVRLSFLCGTDMLLSMGSWHDPATIFRTAEIVCVRREGITEKEGMLLSKVREYEKRFGASIRFLTVAPLEMSSTVIRRRIESGEDLSAYLSPDVETYIKKRRLYV